MDIKYPIKVPYQLLLSNFKGVIKMRRFKKFDIKKGLFNRIRNEMKDMVEERSGSTLFTNSNLKIIVDQNEDKTLGNQIKKQYRQEALFNKEIPSDLIKQGFTYTGINDAYKTRNKYGYLPSTDLIELAYEDKNEKLHNSTLKYEFPTFEQTGRSINLNITTEYLNPYRLFSNEDHDNNNKQIDFLVTDKGNSPVIAVELKRSFSTLTDLILNPQKVFDTKNKLPDNLPYYFLFCRPESDEQFDSYFYKSEIRVNRYDFEYILDEFNRQNIIVKSCIVPNHVYGQPFTGYFTDLKRNENLLRLQQIHILSKVMNLAEYNLPYKKKETLFI